MKTPLIAMSARSTEHYHTRVFYDNESYYDYVKAGGGIPAVVKANTEEEAENISLSFDALLITGGEDVIPETYHAVQEEKTEPIEEDMERSDVLLYHAFKKQNKPIMGICRGIQIIGAIEGSTLIQHIDHHNQRVEGIAVNDYFHSCSFIEGTAIQKIFGSEAMVNSFHHQVLKEVPLGFTLSAVSEDGYIEAIEKGHILCVQWHPERLLHDPKHKALISYFISLAAKAE